jgi:poly-gamma-glutamate capsule biosynthesis protein CapA/YwtB (metallophosphatase superfamily)
MIQIANTIKAVLVVILVVVLVIAVSKKQYSIFGKETYKREHTTKSNIMNKQQEATSTLMITFVGDMMFDRYIRKMSLKHGDDHVFSCIAPFLTSSDMVVGNLEGPITSRPSTSMGSAIGSKDNYSFTFPTSTAQVLARHNISIVSLGNNHSTNQGYKGLTETHMWLRKSGVAYFGGVKGNDPVYRVEKNNTPLSFIGYNQFGGDDVDIVAKKIQQEKETGRVVIVYAHWGDEYKEVNEGVREIARLFVTSGASLIIGSHPHVIQRSEVIDGVFVYYSLGNFIFDQYFQEDVKEGLVVVAKIDSNRHISSSEYRVLLQRDGRTCLK